MSDRDPAELCVSGTGNKFTHCVVATPGERKAWEAFEKKLYEFGERDPATLRGALIGRTIVGVDIEAHEDGRDEVVITFDDKSFVRISPRVLPG